MRWYSLPPNEKSMGNEYLISNQEINLSQNPGAQDNSFASTQCSAIINFPQNNIKEGAISDRSSIVGIQRALLKTISYFCQVCKTCIIRDKNPRMIISEYCKRVYIFLRFLLVDTVLHCHNTIRKRFMAFVQDNKRLLQGVISQFPSISKVFPNKSNDYSMERKSFL